jgi:hypothetical protein
MEKIGPLLVSNNGRALSTITKLCIIHVIMVHCTDIIHLSIRSRITSQNWGNLDKLWQYLLGYKLINQERGT